MAWIGKSYSKDPTKAQHVFVQQMVKNVVSNTACFVDLKHPNPIPTDDLNKTWKGFYLIHGDASKDHIARMTTGNSQKHNTLVYDLNDMIQTLGGKRTVDVPKKKTPVIQSVEI